LGVALLDWAEKYNFGFAKFVSLGNKVDLEESEILEFLSEDPQTKVIVLYLEEISNPAKFLSIARKLSRQKPIIILKGGVTTIGAKAAFSHTAAMVTPRHINEAIFAQANLIYAETLEEMLNIIKILATEPATKSKEIAIITNAGGPGILTTDMAVKSGIIISPPNPSLKVKLQKRLSDISTVANPIDLTGQAKAQDYENAIDLVLSDKQYSGIVTLLTPQAGTEIEKTAEVLAKKTAARKPIVASFLGAKLVKPGFDILKKASVPCFEDPENAVKALGKVISFWEKYTHPQDFIELHHNDQEIMPSGDALELVSRYNIPVPPSGVATNMDVAMKIVGRIGFPVAVKNISKKYVHKYKSGKVILNVQTEGYLKTAITKVGWPVLIQRMVDSPFEIIIGAKRDSDLGVIVTFGWGGVFAEDLDDLALRILPLTEGDLDEMIKETKIGRILLRENVDLSGIKNVLIEVCQIMTDFSDIQELDLNPLKITDGEIMCVDARYK
jgi:acetyltransferase